jgi:hypothetical protein
MIEFISGNIRRVANRASKIYPLLKISGPHPLRNTRGKLQKDLGSEQSSTVTTIKQAFDKWFLYVDPRFAFL